jgi:hypothetical protein
MKIKAGIAVLVFIFVSLLSFGYANARLIEANAPWSNSIFGNIGQSLDNLGRRVSDVVHNQICAGIKTKVGTKEIWISGMKTVHLTQYKSVRDRLAKAIDEAGHNGYDTQKLEYDRATLEIKINTFERDFDIFKNKMEEIKNGVCGNTNDQNRSKMREARILLQTVRNDAKDVRDFYTNEIKVDMLVLKQQKYKN